MRKLIAIILLFLPGLIMAQNREAIKLNTVTKSKGISNTEYKLIDLNKDAFNRETLYKGNKFLFELDTDLAHEYEITRVTEYVPGIISVSAKKKGEDYNSFTFSYSKGKIDGLLHQTGSKDLFIGYKTIENSNYIANKPDELPLDLKHDALIPDALEIKDAAKNKIGADNSADVPSTAAVEAFMDEIVTIDLMIVYTNAAKDWADDRSSIEQIIAQSMNLAQTGLDNSEAGINLRLVHTYNTDYDEINDGVDSEKRLRRLTNTPGLDIPTDPSWDNTTGYMRQVHTLRTQYGADLVAMYAKIEDTGGLAWILSNPGGSPHWGFSVNRVQQIAVGYTLIHEIGHNMGNNHSRTQESAAADDAGGLFHYSAGYQDKSNGFHTIMAYSDGLQQAPFFSSPYLTYNGKALGQESSLTPTNNASSMTEIKYMISKYRPTKVDPPVLGAVDNSVSVEMNREDNLSFPIALDNSGDSDLMWSADLDIVLNQAPKLKERVNYSDFKSHVEFDGPVTKAGIGLLQKSTTKNKGSEEVLYSTSFETSEGFLSGKYAAINQWRAMSGDKSINISTNNPKTGSNSFRIDSKPGTSTQFTESPYFGALPLGTYELEMEMGAFGADALTDRYDIYIYDGKTGQMSAGIVITDGGTFNKGLIYVWDRGEDGNYQFFSTNTKIQQDTYHNFKVRFDPGNGTVSYYLDGTLFTTKNYAAGRTPGYARILHFNNKASTSFNIDDFKLTKVEEGYPWLKLRDYGSVIRKSNSGNINLDFNTRGVEAGQYETKVSILTNDPNKPALVVPIYLTVRTTVGTEMENELPKRAELKQNIPNPFNPSTNINFVLSENTDVKLEVYTIQGQKVATLVNQRMQMGSHDVRFDASHLASGVYLYRLITPSRVITKSMVLIK